MMSVKIVCPKCGLTVEQRTVSQNQRSTEIEWLQYVEKCQLASSGFSIDCSVLGEAIDGCR